MIKINTYKHFLSVCVVLIFMFLAFGSDDNSTLDLNASVKFDGYDFIISNNDNFSYRNSRLELNSNYYLNNVNINSREVIRVNMWEFSDKNGNRFTELQKPQSFKIWCDVDGGSNGFYYAEW